MRITEDIAPREAFIYVPFKVMMTLDRAAQSEIGHVFTNHPEMFKEHQDAE
jgi:hypothetical protein